MSNTTDHATTPDTRRAVGRHRRPATRTGLVMAVVAAAAASGLVLAPAAYAEPGQGGVTGGGQGGVTGGGQGGVTGVAPAPAAPAPEPEIVPTQDQTFLPGYTPSPTVQQYGFRSYGTTYDSDSYESYDDTTYTAPPAPIVGPAVVTPSPTPPPTVTRSVIRAVKAPENTILVGANPIARPDWVDPVLADQFNNTTQAIQADGANALVQAGFADAPRADRIAAGTAAGVITGGLVGGAALGVPATAVGALGGGLIGGGLGTLAATSVVWAGPVGWVFVPGAAALGGAGIGAAALGVPATVIGAGIGGAIGGALGATAAGGESATIEEPAPTPAPEIPPAPPAPVDTADIVIADVTTQAQSAAESVRDVAAATPAGAEAIAAVDQAVQQSAPLVDQASALVNAAFAGLPA